MQLPGISINSVGVVPDPPLPELEEVPTPELTDKMSLWRSGIKTRLFIELGRQLSV